MSASVQQIQERMTARTANMSNKVNGELAIAMGRIFEQRRRDSLQTRLIIKQLDKDVEHCSTQTIS